MSKHTPGPWKVVRDGNPLSAGIVAVIEHSERFLAVEEDHFGGPWCAPDTWEANARLIAAAPDLLEALRGYQREATSYHTTCGHGEEGSVAECDSICEQMAAGAKAIAKAEGR
jgi:hypothetical protein